MLSYKNKKTFFRVLFFFLTSSSISDSANHLHHVQVLCWTMDLLEKLDTVFNIDPSGSASIFDSLPGSILPFSSRQTFNVPFCFLDFSKGDI